MCGWWEREERELRWVHKSREEEVGRRGPGGAVYRDETSSDITTGPCVCTAVRCIGMADGAKPCEATEKSDSDISRVRYGELGTISLQGVNLHRLVNREY